MVLTFAMLFAVTSIMSWWFLRPPMALNMERSMRLLFAGALRAPRWSAVPGRSVLVWGAGGRAAGWCCAGPLGGGRRVLDLDDGAGGDLLAVDREDRSLGIGAHGADDARGLLAVRPAVRDGLADQRDRAGEVLAELQRGDARRQLGQLLDAGELRHLAHHLRR